METGAITPSPLPFPVPTNNGLYVFGADGGVELQRLAVSTGIITAADVPFPALQGWELTEVHGADDSGRFVLLRASSAGQGRTAVFLFDFETEELVGSGSVSSSTGLTNALPRSISADGNIIQYQEFVAIGGAPIVEWNRATDERRRFGLPAEIINPETWGVSRDFEWVAFVSHEADVIPGLSAEPRMYRREVATGETTVIDLDVDDLWRFEVFNGGRVVLVVNNSPAASGGGYHVSVSDAGGPTVQLNVAPDGTPARQSISLSRGRFFGADDEAKEITFVSYDENLLTGTGEPGHRWYVVSVADEDPGEDSDSIAGAASATAQAVRCSPVC